jgi:hypothetical protein
MKDRERMVRQIKKGSNALAFNPITENLTRIGYGVRGLIYGTIGVLALMIALGISGSLQDQQGAIASIGKQPLGLILLGIVLIGVVGYSIWGLIRTFFDPLNRGKSIFGLFERAGYFASAVGYANLVLPTYYIMFKMPNAAQNGAQGIQIRSMIATAFSIPLGRWIVGIVGLVILLSGLYQGYLGLRHKFDQNIKPIGLTLRQEKAVKIIGRFGIVGRAVVFCILGLFLMTAAYQANSADAKGLDGALLSVLSQPYGVWLLGILALSLIAFGCYSLMNAFWFKFERL